MANTKIEYAEKADNVFVTVDEAGRPNGTYCTKVSAGCRYCYAEKLNQGAGFYRGNGKPFIYTDPYPKMAFRSEMCEGWSRQTKTHVHFINTMTDTFGEFIPTVWIVDLFNYMEAAHRQRFIIVTKRAKRMAEFINLWLEGTSQETVPDHILLIATTEDQKTANERIPHLTSIPGRLGISAEPLLGAIDLYEAGAILPAGEQRSDPLPLIDWIVAGGESGYADGIRPCYPDHVRQLRDQASQAGIPFFFKQWGRYKPYENRDGDPPVFRPTTKKIAGRTLDGRTYDDPPWTPPPMPDYSKRDYKPWTMPGGRQ